MDEKINKSSAELLANLKVRERTFVLELRKHGKQGAAAAAAGYKNPDVAASRLMRREDIQRALKTLYKEDCEARCLTAESVILKAADIYDRCMQSEPVMKYDSAAGEWVESGIYQFDSKGAAKALDVIAKVAGLGKEKLEVSNSEGKNFKVDITVVE